MKRLGKVLPIATAGAVAMFLVPSAATAARSTHAGSSYHAPASTEMVTLGASKVTYHSPGGSREGSVPKTRPITGEETTLPVLRSTTRGNKTWYEVRLPGRPNSHTGWITSGKTSTWENPWYIVISVGPNTSSFSSQRKAYVYKSGRLMKSWLVVTGAPGRVTPTGHFFVEENIDEGWNFPGGPYALATSARSTTYTEFDGGPGQVALHGMAGGLNATPGTAVSHGCVRFPNREITWLASRIYPGTPVEIVP